MSSGKKSITSLESTPFERIKHLDEQGEYWIARELMPLLTYSKWQDFENVINKAKTACEKSGLSVDDQFTDLRKLVERPQGGGNARQDYRLTRYACYLIAQNGDPFKKEIALAQTYFAIQTRKQEIAELEKLEQERRNIRQSCSENYKIMSTALQKTRARLGKDTQQHHYVNEARLVNMIALDKNTKDLQKLAGQKNFRDFLSREALYNIDVVEAGNTWFLAQGLEYKDRKEQLAAGKPNLEQIHDGNRFLPLFNQPALLEGSAKQMSAL